MHAYVCVCMHECMCLYVCVCVCVLIPTFMEGVRGGRWIARKIERARKRGRER